MAEKFDPTRKEQRSDLLSPSKNDITRGQVKEAKKLFSDFPDIDCNDVALQIGVSVNTLRKYLRDECWEVNKRRMREALRRKG